MTSPKDPNATDTRDFVTRYFLRRLAIARQSTSMRAPETQYTDALLETILALWRGHQHVQTTQVYLDATLAMKEKARAKVTPRLGHQRRYHAGDRLPGFLRGL